MRRLVFAVAVSLPLVLPASAADVAGLLDKMSRSDPAEASLIAIQIERAWAATGSDVTDLLADRAAQAAREGDLPLSVELLGRTLRLRPDWAEGWVRRAGILFAMGDAVRAADDLRRALAADPRHYTALFGLAGIMEEEGDLRSAYRAYAEALAINPGLEQAREALSRISVGPL